MRDLTLAFVALQTLSITARAWEKMEPVMDEYRICTRARMVSESEYLYNELMRYLEEHPVLKT